MKDKQTTKRVFAALAVIAVLALLAWGYFALKKAGLLTMLSSPEALRDWVEGFGAWGPAVFFLVQFSQVIIAPIPGSVTALAGGLLFGFWKGMLISVGAMILGSAVAFLLARRLGRPFVRFLVGQAVMDKYVDVLGERGMGVLFMMLLLPFFPDDALCFIAGLTTIPLPFFLLAVVVTRPAGLIFSSLVGAGIITIPLWGWVLIGLASLGFLWASWKYGDALNRKMLAWLARRDKKKDSQ
ncbi:MAG: TVP38/TMEM64 family protein [Eubacteriales bacterium]|nr:TVP38/TMEM64 family protein [Eubacteriales bacterium]